MKNKSLCESFRHAAHGFFTLLKEERNLRIHVCITVIVICAAVVLNLSAAEKAVVTALCFGVICAELINSAIENAVDLSCGVFNMYAKRAKDFAAGAVLILSCGAAVCGLIIFLPHIIQMIDVLF